jgi:hypothetical protein
MKLFTKMTLVILTIVSFSCSYNKTLLKTENKYVIKQLDYLNKESDIFLAKSEQKNFEKNLFDYLKRCKSYNFFNGRENPVLLLPLIINENDKALALVAVRKKDNSNDDLDYVKFISAKLENNNWVFGLKEGHSYSFSYVNKTFPRLTNKKIAEQTISNLMLEGFFKDNLKDKSIFKSSWYIF